MKRIWVGLVVLGASVSAYGADLGAARVWISETGHATHTRIGLNVRFTPVQAAETPVIIEGEVLAEGPSGPTEVEAVIRDAAGAVVHTGLVNVEVEEKSNPYRFTWPAQDLADGLYRARVTLWRGRGGDLAYTELDVLKLSRSTVDGMLSHAETSLGELEAHLDSLGLDKPSSPYVTLPLALASDSVAFARRVDSDWPRIRGIANYVEEVCARVRAQLTFGRTPLEWEVWSTPPMMAGVTRKPGALYAEDRPIFLGGFVAGADPTEAIARANRYGLNFVSVAYDGSAATEPQRVLNEAEAANIGVHYELRLLREDGTVGLRGSASPPAAGALAVREGRARVTALAGHPNLVAASLARKPVFHLEGDSVQRAFAGAMESRYEEYYRMNRAWKTRLVDFAQAPIWFEYDHPAYQYDWQRFHQELVGRYVTGMTEAARGLAPGVPLTMTFDDRILSPFQTSFGVAEERLASLFDIMVTGASMSPADATYATSFPRETMYYTLIRSFAQDKALLNVQPATPQPDISPEHARRYLRTLVWDGAMEGLNGLALNGWRGEPDGEHPLASAPEAMEGFVTAVYDVNRLADIVLAFQQAPAEIGILWSESSRILRGGEAFLTSVARAFEGVSFSGMKIRFVTEDQIAAGTLGSLRVLVVPEAPAISDEVFHFIENFTKEHNGVIIRAAKPMPYNSWGLSREDVIKYEGDVLLVRGDDVPVEYLDATDAASYEKEIDSVPRPINAFGYPLEGVRMRHVVYEGRTYVYVVNLRNDAVQCHLSSGEATGVDLISGHAARFPTALTPLTPMLVRLDPAPEDFDVAAEVAVEPTGVPTAEIGAPPPPELTEDAKPGSSRRLSPKH